MTGNPNPIVARQLAELGDVLTRISPDEFAAASQAIAEAPAVFLAGRGRNQLAMAGFGNRMMQLGKPVALIGDILTGPVRRGDLVAVATSSGTGAMLLGIARTCQELGARVLALTGRAVSPLAECTDVALVIPTQLVDGSPSSQPLGTLFEQCLALTCDALVADLMGRLNVTAEDMRRRHANVE